MTAVPQPRRPQALSRDNHGTGSPQAGLASPGQQRAAGAGLRMAIEMHAEDHAAAHFAGAGWQVERVGRSRLGYDLECTRPDGSVLHVEVKGTSTLGEKVFLTANEVEHARPSARCGAEHILYVVSQIDVPDGRSSECSGGKADVRRPWTISDDDLTPVQYVYFLRLHVPLKRAVPVPAHPPSSQDASASISKANISPAGMMAVVASRVFVR